jgi:hypothetical protein
MVQAPLPTNLQPEQPELQRWLIRLASVRPSLITGLSSTEKSIQPVDPVAAVQNSKWVGSTRYGGAQKFVPRPTARYAIISFEVTQGHEVCMRGTYCPQMPFRRPATAVPTYSAHYQWTLDRGSNFLSNRTSTAKNVHSKTVRQLTI